MARGVGERIAHGRPAFDLLPLTFAAGLMDALSYFQNHVFTANMTGNAVVLGLSLAGSERSRTLPTALSFCLVRARGVLRRCRTDPIENQPEFA